MTEMKSYLAFHSQTRSRRLTTRAIHFALLALALVFALPMHAENRPIKQRVPPAYPELAKRMKISGVVRVSATVAPDGSVTATKTLSGNHMLSPAAEDAVHKWKFVAAAEESTVEVEINFALVQ
jgi:TonB family protein